MQNIITVKNLIKKFYHNHFYMRFKRKQTLNKKSKSITRQSLNKNSRVFVILNLT